MGGNLKKKTKNLMAGNIYENGIPLNRKGANMENRPPFQMPRVINMAVGLIPVRRRLK